MSGVTVLRAPVALATGQRAVFHEGVGSDAFEGLVLGVARSAYVVRADGEQATRIVPHAAAVRWLPQKAGDAAQVLARKILHLDREDGA